MATILLPINVGQASGLEELTGAAPPAVNVISEPGEKGALRLRPGLSTWEDFPATIPNASAIIGMQEWNGHLVYVTADRKIWEMPIPGVVNAISDSTAATQLDGSAPPVFAKTVSRLIIAGGGLLQKWAGPPNLAVRLGGSPAPPLCTHVIAIAKRLVVNVYGPASSGIMQWTDAGVDGVADPDWPLLNFEEAEARADPLLALRENTNEAFGFGSETLQVFSPDPNLILASGRTVTIGVGAPYSVLSLDEQGAFAFLDSRKQIQVTDGRQAQPISDPIAATLDGIETVSDCWSFRAKIGPWDFWAFVFPTEGRTFVFESKGKRWFEQRSFEQGAWKPWAPTSYFYWADKKLHLIGLSTGQIVKLDATATTDVGQAIKAQVILGFDDYGNDELKMCTKLRLTMRRGLGTGAISPVVEVSWRDDLGAFCTPKRFSIGRMGESSSFAEERVLGQPFHKRQWKFEVTDPVLLSIAKAEMTLENLGSGS